MKKLLLVCLVSVPFSSFAGMSLEQKVKMLEKRIERLERGSDARSQVDAGSGLKMRDMSNDKMQTGLGGARGVSSAQGMPEMSKEQQEEVMKQLELFKSRQAESQKILDELMKEP